MPAPASITFGGMANLGFDPRDNSTLYGIIRPKYAGSYLRRGTPDGHWQTMPTPLDNATIETGMTVDGGTGALYVTTQVAPVGLWQSTQSECHGREGCPVGARSRLRAGRAGQPAGFGVGARWAGDLRQHLAFDAAHRGRRHRRQPGAPSFAGRRADLGAAGDAVMSGIEFLKLPD